MISIRDKIKFFDIISGNLGAVTEKAKVVVQYFYYFYTLFIVTEVLSFSSIQTRYADGGFDPHWLIAWANGIPLPTTLEAIKIIVLGLGMLTLIFYQKRWVRILVFLSFLQVYGVFNSINSRVDHSLYTLLFTLLFFMCVPNIWKYSSNEKKKVFNVYVWGAQAFVLLSYTMVGVNKIISSIQQWIAGDIGFLSFHGLSVIVAHKTAEFDTYVAFSDIFVHMPWLGFIAAVISVYILTFSIYAAFKPRLHMVWGLLLIGYHFMTFATIGLGFFVFIGVDIFLFVNSPFTPEDMSFRSILKDLPGIGWVYKRLRTV